MKSILTVIAILLLCFASSSFGHTVTCSGGADILADLTTALSESPPGDTITITAGSCSMSSALTWNKAVTITGAGKTLTTVDLTGRFATIPYTLDDPTGIYRLTGLKFTGTNPVVAIGIDGTYDYVRIDNINFACENVPILRVGYDGTFRESIYGDAHPQTRKVLVHSIEHNPSVQGRQFLLLYGNDADWQEDDDWGSDRAVIIEGSTFNNPSENYGITDTEHAGRYIFRYNTVINSWGACNHDFGGQPSRGQRLKEVYNNQFICTEASCLQVFGNIDRGGSSLVYNNIATGAFASVSGAMIYRVSYDTSGIGGGSCATSASLGLKICQDVQRHCVGGSKDGQPCYSADGECTGGGTCGPNVLRCSGGTNNWGICTTSADCPGLCNTEAHTCVLKSGTACTTDADCNHSCVEPIAGCTSDDECLGPGGSAGLCMLMDSTGTGGYPCRDQMGRGKDGVDGTQANLPTRWWNNKINNVATDLAITATDYVQLNREYCTSTGTSMPNPCNSIDLTYTPRACPDPRAGLTGTYCDTSIAGASGYGLTGGRLSGGFASGGLVSQ